MEFLKREKTIQDSQLESASQQKIASLVKSLPSEDLSMSWRSQLNEKLMAAELAKKKQRKTRRAFAWGSTLSFGAAAGVFGILMMNGPQAVAPIRKVESPTMASELVKTHQESMVLASVSGTGAAARETSLEEDVYGTQDELL